MLKHPKELGNNFKFRELTRSEMQTEMWRKIRFLHVHYPEIYLNDKIYNYPYFSWSDYN